MPSGRTPSIVVPDAKERFGLMRLHGSALRRALRLITVAWLFGSVWMTASAGAPLTLFAKGLGATRFEFGILASLPYLASLVSLISTVLTERVGRRRLLFLIGLYLQRWLWFPIALLPLWIIHRFGTDHLPYALWTFLGLMFLMNCGQGIGGVPWTSWMADIVPARVRGKYFSRRRQWGILTAIPTAIFVGWVLDHHLQPTQTWAALSTCSMLFLFAAVFGVVDIATFHFVPDLYKPPQTGGTLLRALVEPLRNRSFLWAAGFVALMTFALTFMNQFVTLYLIEQVKATNSQVQIMVLIGPAVAQLLTLSVWGAAVDRMGKKPLLILSGIGMVLPGLGWSLVTPINVWLGYLVAFVGTALWTGIDIANSNLVLELAGSDGEGSSSYVAVNAIVINVAGCLGGLASGVIANALGDWHWQPMAAFKTLNYFDVLFGLSALLRFAAVVIFLPHIHEPAARPSVEALRFMTSNIYSNLVGAAMQPVRFIRRAKERSE